MGYDHDRFTCKFSMDLVCSICLGVLEDPVECKKCETNFCSECINSWKQRNNKCPNNCELSLSKSHRFLRSFLDALTLKCANESAGCLEVLTLSQIKTHESTVCKYRIFKCKYPGCYETFNSSEIEEHQQNCPKKIIACGGCGEEIKVVDMTNHSCISLLSCKIESLIVKYQENSKKLEEIENVCNDKISADRKETHFGINCSSCLVDPILGIRHVCLECPDYNLCWRCYGNVHIHHSFFQLATVDVHESVTCDECLSSPIRGIRYKCKTCEDFGNCYSDLCHKCKLNKRHEHEDYFAWCPYTVFVTPLVPEKIGYKEGDLLIREWEIFNNSTQEIKNLELVSLSGDTCSIFYLARRYCFSFPDFLLLPKSSAILTLKDKIFQTIPGIYKCQLRMSTVSRVSPFGPLLTYELAIVNPNF